MDGFRWNVNEQFWNAKNYEAYSKIRLYSESLNFFAVYRQLSMTHFYNYYRSPSITVSFKIDYLCNDEPWFPCLWLARDTWHVRVIIGICCSSFTPTNFIIYIRTHVCSVCWRTRCIYASCFIPRWSYHNRWDILMYPGSCVLNNVSLLTAKCNLSDCDSGTFSRLLRLP